jgi:hypothetical protein
MHSIIHILPVLATNIVSWFTITVLSALWQRLCLATNKWRKRKRRYVEPYLLSRSTSETPASASGVYRKRRRELP